MPTDSLTLKTQSKTPKSSSYVLYFKSYGLKRVYKMAGNIMHPYLANMQTAKDLVVDQDLS